MAALPEEVIEEILSRLPVKSLLRFKTVSKKWYSLISQDHRFHMKQSSYASQNRILYKTFANDGTVFRYSDTDSHESHRFIFPAEIVESCNVIGSANGLICLCPIDSDRGSCFIWNPCTGECKFIPLPFLVASDYWGGQVNSGYPRLFGFGYDSISDDYKIIGGCNSCMRVFSLKTNSWKILEFSVKCPPRLVYGFHLNGALHWCVRATEPIAAFDLAKEKIFFIELPEKMKLGYWRYPWLPLFDYHGSLCTCDGKSIWVMREYGDPKSWSKLSTPVPKECYADAVPKGISRLGELVYHTRRGLGLVKSYTGGRIADEDKSQMLDSSGAYVYKESLISPKCFDPK